MKNLRLLYNWLISLKSESNKIFTGNLYLTMQLSPTQPKMRRMKWF